MQINVVHKKIYIDRSFHFFIGHLFLRLLRLAPIYLGVCTALLTGVVLGHFLPPGKFEYGPGIPRHLLTWDGCWYRDIAEHGYSWSKDIGMHVGRYQNVAFFPFFPLIEHFLMVLTGSRSWITTTAPGVVFGLWSIASFDRLAQKLLPDQTSSLYATALYAFWPASCFFFMGYPTGLINICAINAIDAYLDRKFIRSGLWCGIGSATAPTIVFVAFGLCLDQGWQWLRSPRKIQQTPNVIGFGLLSVSGLLAFMAYLWFSFGNPIVFMSAQAAWAVPSSVIPTESLITHIELMFFPPWYGLSFFKSVILFFTLIHSHTEISNYKFSTMNNFFQYDVDVFATIIAIIVLVRYRKFKILSLTGTIITVGYIWFFASTYNYFINGIRLLYPVFLIFIAGGSYSLKHRRTGMVVVIASFCLTCLEIALVWSGYMVI
jgi:hypothetical protein